MGGAHVPDLRRLDRRLYRLRVASRLCAGTARRDVYLRKSNHRRGTRLGSSRRAAERADVRRRGARHRIRGCTVVFGTVGSAYHENCTRRSTSNLICATPGLRRIGSTAGSALTPPGAGPILPTVLREGLWGSLPSRRAGGCAARGP